MAGRARRLPPLASDVERIEAARIAADSLCAHLRESELVESAWLAKHQRWNHYIDSAGGVYSVREP